MKKLRPYFVPVVTLITDLLALCWRVIRALILPTLTRKGNLLSSVFVLFTSVTEQIIGFGETVARIPGMFELPARFDNIRTFSRKYLRQGMLIAAWALFILSSLEWTSAQPAATRQATAEQTAAQQPSVEQIARQAGSVNERQKIVSAGGYDLAIALLLAEHLSISPPPYPGPRWLLLCTLRI